MIPFHPAPDSLAELSSDALTARIAELLGTERICVVELLRHLAELDRRQTHLELGYPSLFAYCTDALRLSKASAWRRTTAARLLTRFPAAADYLADGRLCLSTFVLLRDVLVPDNHLDLLERASLRSEEEVQQLVATILPRPEVKTSIRRLPSSLSASSGPELPLDTSPVPQGVARESEPLASPSNPTVSSGPELSLNTAPNLQANSAPVPVAARRARLEPIDAERHSLKMTVGAEFMAELAEVKSALSHVVPDGDLETVLRRCMQQTLEVLARRQRASSSKQPRATKAATSAPAAQDSKTPKPESRHIPAAVRRAVWTRDEGRCAFIGRNGRRCNSRHQLELDHLEPYAWGGAATVDNLRLVCRAHNQHYARTLFGDARMAQYGPRQRQGWTTPASRNEVPLLRSGRSPSADAARRSRSAPFPSFDPG